MNCKTKLPQWAIALGGLFALGAGPAFADNQAMLQLLNVLHAKGTIDDASYEAIIAATKTDEAHNSAVVAAVSKKTDVVAQKVAAASGNDKSTSGVRITVGNAIKTAAFFGDLRVRYEYRDAMAPSTAYLGNLNPSNLGTPYATERDRARYSLRAGVRGEISPQWDYGFRLETGTNGRGTWLTMAQKNYYNSTSSPSNNTLGDKSATSFNVGQAYLAYKPVEGLKITAGRMGNPLMTTSMVWDPDINVEGLSEQYVYPVSKDTKLFLTAGQWVYSADSPPSTVATLANYSTGSTFLFASQAGIIQKLTETVELKAGLTGYSYSKAKGDGLPAGGALGTTGYFFTGTGGVATDNYINNLSIIEIPVQITFPVSDYKGLVFMDFAHNMEANQRMALDSLGLGNVAIKKGKLTVGHTPYQFADNHNADGGADAFMFGWSIASAGVSSLTINQGLWNGGTARAGSWEIRNYFQRVGLAAIDPNLLDSDFFERTNMQGVYIATAYAPVDGIVTTLKYGLATRLDKKAGTAGTNSDSISTQTINNYQELQAEVAMKW